VVRFLIVVPHANSDTDPLAAEMATKLYHSLHHAGMRVVEVLFGETDRRVKDLESKHSRGTKFRKRINQWALEGDVILLDIHSTEPNPEFPEWFIVDTPKHDDWFSEAFITYVGEIHHGYSSRGNDLIFQWERRGLPGLMIEFQNTLTPMQKDFAVGRVVEGLKMVLEGNPYRAVLW
jgi:hypothetical protein